jgi:16S rRNA processing protein RimM
MAAGRVHIGRILKAHGIRGEVSFLAAGNDSEPFRPGSVLHLEETGGETLTVRSVRSGDRFWLLSFEEVGDRDNAEALAGRPLFLEEEALPPLPAGDYYQFQLLGLAVTRADRSRLGKVDRVVEMPSDDLLEVHGAEGDFLIPIRREFVEWVDLENGEIRLADRADLLEAQTGPPVGEKRTPRRKGRSDRNSGSAS